MQFPSFKFEIEKYGSGIQTVAGCDEVGIAPLAGPVVAAALILDKNSVSGRRSKNKWWSRVRDSKTVPEKERIVLAGFIKEHCISFGVGVVSHETIDRVNIYNAAMQAMRLALNQMKQPPEFLFVDGRHKIKNLEGIRQEAVVDGDAKILSVAAASILAKVARDQILDGLHQLYPAYHFHKNKGYPTKFHREALVKHGASPVHRKSFTLVQQCFQGMFPVKPSLLGLSAGRE